MPIFAWLGVLAVIFGCGDWIALAFWLVVAATINVVLSIAVSKIWPGQDWTMMQEVRTVKQAVTKTTAVAVGLGIAWYLSVLTGGYLEHLVKSAIDPIIALILRR
jgi:hypothetical protein